jgi:hypothetical protein
VLAIVGGGLAAIGAFLPWVTATAAFVGTVTRSGMEGGDGPIFLGVGILVAALGLWAVLDHPTAAPILLILAGVAIVGLTVPEYIEVNERVGGLDSDFATASVGAGIWALFAGGVATGLAGLILIGQMTPPPVPALPASVTGIAPPPGPGAVRTCPYCREAMQRDASVCPHCRRESQAWTYEEGRWWTTDPSGARVWLDERKSTWHQEPEASPPG